LLADPQSVTVNSVAQSLPKTSSNGTSSVYEKADGTYKLTVSHLVTRGDRLRSLIRFDHKAVVSNPLDSTNDYDTQSIQIVLERPNFGFTATDLSNDWAGIKAWLDSTMVTKLFGRES
jgi:hypothetical protein